MGPTARQEPPGPRPPPLRAPCGERQPGPPPRRGPGPPARRARPLARPGLTVIGRSTRACPGLKRQRMTRMFPARLPPFVSGPEFPSLSLPPGRGARRCGVSLGPTRPHRCAGAV